MRFLRVVAALSLLVLIAGCGGDRQAEADKIKQDMIAGFADMFGKDQEAWVGYDALEVAPDGDVFKATVKGVKLLPGEADALSIGDVTFDVSPKDDDKYEVANLKLPSGVSVKLPEGEGTAKFDIGEQQFAGLWSKSLQNFITMDAAFKNIQMASDKGEKVVIGELTAKNNAEDKGGGLWDQTGSGTATGIAIASTDGGLSIATIAYSSAAKGVKVAEMRQLRDSYSALVRASLEGKAADQATVDALKRVTGLFAESTGKAELGGLAFTDPSGQALFQLDSLAVDGGLFGFDQPKGRFDTKFRFEGLAIPALTAMPDAQAFAQFIPSRLSFGIGLDDLPPSEMWKLLLDVMTVPPDNEAAMAAAAETVGMSLIQAAQQSGSSFRLEGWEYDSPAVKVNLGGTVTADATALMGAVASIKAEIVGLDDILQMAQLFGAGDPMMTSSFDLLRQYSERSTTADGKPRDLFAIELAQSGETTINGKPFDPMAAAMPSDPSLQGGEPLP